MRLSVRVPRGWSAHIYSRKVQAWLREFIRTPRILPSDPRAAGGERLCLSLSESELKRVAGYLGCSPSVAIRRLAAHFLLAQRAKATVAPVTSRTVTAARTGAPGAIDSGPPLVKPGGRYMWRGCDLTHLRDSRSESALASLVAGGMPQDEARTLIFGAYEWKQDEVVIMYGL
jgi:hypothetical protein